MSQSSSKSLILSSSGLKNVTLNCIDESFYKNDNFRFIFGDKEITMNRFFADFISPRASRIHYSDATVDFIDLSRIASFFSLINEESDLFSDEAMSLFHKLSSGYEIELNDETSQKLRFISILIGNEELYHKIGELFQREENEEDFDKLIQYLLTLKDCDSLFSDEKIIEFLSKSFFSIEKEKLLKLPKSALYSIISNPNLRIESEDSLVDFIYDIFETDEDDENESFSMISFLELVHIESLSENKMIEIIEMIEPQNISKTLWEKFIKLINNNNNNSTLNLNEDRYATIQTSKQTIFQIPYDLNSLHQFEGILYYLRQQNSDDFENEVEITASSYRTERSRPQNAADFTDDDKYFGSKNLKGSWLCYNFKNRKVKPSYYSIKSWQNPKGNHHVKSWEIQASNDEKEWKVLDSRSDENSLDGSNLSKTFDIRFINNSNEFYKYIRIVQVGLNTGGTLYLNIQSLEFFGDILGPK